MPEMYDDVPEARCLTHLAPFVLIKVVDIEGGDPFHRIVCPQCTTDEKLTQQGYRRIGEMR
jgi:hypothetical protein